MKYVVYYIGIICLYCGYGEGWLPTWIPNIHECQDWEEFCQPTIIDVPNFNVTSDAYHLYDAQKNARYEKLINIIARRSVVQRQSIFHEYKRKWGSDLVKILKNKLPPGNFKELILALTKPLPIFFKDELIISMSIPKHRHLNMLDILGALSNVGVKSVENTYNESTDVGHCLRADLRTKARMSGELLQLFKLLIWSDKPEGKEVNDTLINEDVRVLKMAEGVERTDFYVFYNIILKRNNAHLRKVYWKFLELNGHTVGKSLARDRFPKEQPILRSALIALYKITENRAIYFARRLHSNLKRSCCTDHNTIRRIIVGRAEIDLENIKAAYYNIYYRTLANMIEQRTTDLYKFTLLKLLEDTPIVTDTMSRIEANTLEPLEENRERSSKNEKATHEVGTGNNGTSFIGDNCNTDIATEPKTTNEILSEAYKMPVTKKSPSNLPANNFYTSNQRETIMRYPLQDETPTNSKTIVADIRKNITSKERSSDKKLNGVQKKIDIQTGSNGTELVLVVTPKTRISVTLKS